jgi:hypothetical protein
MDIPFFLFRAVFGYGAAVQFGGGESRYTKTCDAAESASPRMIRQPSA